MPAETDAEPTILTDDQRLALKPGDVVRAKWQFGHRTVKSRPYLHAYGFWVIELSNSSRPYTRLDYVTHLVPTVTGGPANA
jgi:hypothetical protein